MTDPTPDAAPPAEAAEPISLEACDRFTSELYQLRRGAEGKKSKWGASEARARLARLRRALGRRGVDYAALADIGDFLPGPPNSRALEDSELDDYLLVAALYALHASGSGEMLPAQSEASFGTAASWLQRVLSGGKRDRRNPGLDLRFGALLDARREDLPYRLRQIVAMMATQSVGVRYDQLLHDLLRWDNTDLEDQRRGVQRRWARDYWTGSRPS